MAAGDTAATFVNRAVQLVGGYDNAPPVTGSPPNFDGSTIGEAAGIVYAECATLVGRQFGWDFSRASITLLLTGNTPPLPDLANEYLYPASIIQLRQVLPATYDANDPRPVSWVVGNAEGGSVQATGSIAFSVNPANGSTITLNGRVFTFVNDNSGWPTVTSSYKINIGANIGGTMFFLEQALNESPTYLADSLLNVATYAIPVTTLNITYIVPGTVGNAYTLAASVATPSGAHLTGGVTSQQKVIWTNVANAEAIVTNLPPESIWDAMASEAFIQLLASKLNMALASKPDSSKLATELGAAFQGAGERRTDT
ncbi:MAG: hypothetical protein WCP82_07285 [Alphaproteobacteria bacterium]